MTPTPEPMTSNTKSTVLYKKIGMTQAKRLANELKKFATDNGLAVKIAEKPYMMVEGWQFIGTQLGLTDIVKNCERVETEGKEIKYRAEVEIINQNGTVLSRGFAFASNLEKKKTSFEEYAVASMAQTRAVGKAYRNFLAWIVKMAGYEATPYEEVDKDKLETDLGNAKKNVYKAFKEAGYEDTSKMVEVIQTAISKNSIDTIDDANMVIGYLREIQ